MLLDKFLFASKMLFIKLKYFHSISFELELFYSIYLYGVNVC